MPLTSNHQNLVVQKLVAGTEGHPIQLLANYYKLNVLENSFVYHYDIDISRERQENACDSDSCIIHFSDTNSNKDPFANQVISKMLSENNIFIGVRHVHDGLKNLYTTQPFNFPHHNVMNLDVKIIVDKQPVKFTVRVKLVERITLKEIIEFYTSKRNDLNKRVLSVFETILRFIMGKHYVTFQRKFFDLTSITSSPRVQLAEFISGFTSAVHMTEFGLALNVHLKTSCVINHNISRVSDLANVLAGIQIGRRPSKQQIMDFNRFIRYLRVFTQHGNRKINYTAEGLVDKTVYEIKFTCKRSGQKITVAEYFINEYNITPDLNTVALKMTKKSVYLPLELCFLVPNQFLSTAKINTQIQRDMLLKATNCPNVYFNMLRKVIEKVAACELETQQDFGISLDTNPVTFMGRVLNAPRLLNSNRNDKFNQACKVPKNWGVVCFDSNVTQEQLSCFSSMMVNRARSFGLNLGSPNLMAIVAISEAHMLLTTLTNFQSESQAEFIFVGIPTNHTVIPPAQMYGLVKYYCDQQFGILSQCFKADNVDRTPNGYFDQFLLKVNGKCGGVNSLVEPTQLQDFSFSLTRTMFVGIDVNHPAETQKMAISVSAAVGSLDSNFSRYAASIFVQKKDRDEILKNLESMICELLVEYQKANNALPKNVVIFRDGVSEGQYQKVAATELPDIRAAVTKMTTEPIKIALIIVQKRHNARFALTTVNSQGRRPTWNVPSGTVVDNTIVEPVYKTFYLNSHFSPL
ncbi:PREDICTED: protein argonaute-2-like, partial [Rhagoletis zephyria]|uniref:protein argonaute-2-like n=1 Tax=Rhagoletis zephyria TaxID=28612 RepID=UPI0008115924